MRPSLAAVLSSTTTLPSMLVLAFASSHVASTQFASAQNCTATIAQTEGPYYRTPNPETTFMRRGTDGPLLRLTGRVVDTNCNPIPWSWVAVWHADPAGAYDNVAPFDIYRATSFTDANGEFAFDTISPGLYPGRTKHIHVKVDAANTNLLTTQVYFPGLPQNATDGIYSPLLELTMTTLPDGVARGDFQFVLPIAGACTGATIVLNPASTTVAPGGTAVFASAGAGSTPRTFRWYRNGVEVINSARVSGALTDTLTITGVTIADAGTFTCLSANSCGSQLSGGATLTVPGACPADLDQSGAVDAADLAAVLNGWGACKACDADLNADGAVDAADLATVLNAWGPC